MWKILVAGMLAMAMTLIMPGVALAYESEGWASIRADLLDPIGDPDGEEFVVQISGLSDFTGATEFDKVVAAFNWVVDKITKQEYI